jgi:hypothetical protein
MTNINIFGNKTRGLRGRVRMIVGFTTTYAISSYHQWCCEFYKLLLLLHCLLSLYVVCLMVFNTNIYNISVISWRSVLLLEKTEYPEKTTDLSQVPDKFYHIMLYTSPWSRFELTTSLVIGTDCIGSCKSNYHTNTATKAPGFITKYIDIRHVVMCTTLCDKICQGLVTGRLFSPGTPFSPTIKLTATI